jgi:hypothetical protein
VWRSFALAREFARILVLTCEADWFAFACGEITRDVALPDDIPIDPSNCAAYRDDWNGWGDFLGTGVKGYDQYDWRPFESAVSFVRALGLRSKREWDGYCHGLIKKDAGPQPEDIPIAPDKHYEDEWRGWSWFLGRWTPPAVGSFWPDAAAREWARALGLSSRDEWHQLFVVSSSDGLRLPDGVPLRPNVIYADVWQGWNDFLGLDRGATGRAA